MYMDVSKNSGFSPQIINFNRGKSIINHPFWGTFIFGNTHTKAKNNTTCINIFMLSSTLQKCCLVPFKILAKNTLLLHPPMELAEGHPVPIDGQGPPQLNDVLKLELMMNGPSTVDKTDGRNPANHLR